MVDINNVANGEAIFLPIYEVCGRVLAKVLDYTLYHGTLSTIATANVFENAAASTSSGKAVPACIGEQNAATGNVAAVNGTINAKPVEENAHCGRQRRVTLPLRAMMTCPPPSPAAPDERPLTSNGTCNSWTLWWTRRPSLR
ncbi:hypothetical protein L7F22_016973 [Adiantum nelumboides]|nr:hypothetical protein [Adiantum nelumboides]